MTQIILTNGTETFPITLDCANDHGRDSHGAGYTRCDIGCDHSQVPAGASVWHDDEHTETLWRS